MSKIVVDSKYTNTAFIPIYRNDARYLVIYGGAGSGKSYEIAKLVLSKLLAFQHVNYLIVRQTAKSNRHTTFNQIKQTINRNGISHLFEINKTALTITNKKYGNQILFGGLDDVEKLKSTTFENGILTDIWIEEASETSYDDFLQLDLRLRGLYPNVNFQIIISFNPISKKHWIYERFFDRKDNRAFILKTTYLDNNWIDEETIKTIEYMKFHNPLYYNVYGLGEWGELTEGLIFKREHYIEYDYLPADARGVAYCDPNLSKKGLGDTTAMYKMLYSPSMDIFYVADAFCESYSDTNKLLKDFLSLRDENCRYLGFDGNVSQESSWTQHVNNFCQLHSIPNPIIDYKRYRVDEISKNTQMLWSNGQIQFKNGFSKTKVGETVLTQLYSFAGKKNTKAKDDAPDALVCTTEFIVETGLAQLNKQVNDFLQLTRKR